MDCGNSKKEARVHEIDVNLIQGMWRQGKDSVAIRKGLIMNSDQKMLQAGRINFPHLPDLISGGGFSIGLWLTIDETDSRQQVLSTLQSAENGIEIFLAEDNNIGILLKDGKIRQANILKNTQFVSDQNTIKEGGLHHVMFTIDGAAKIATIIVDGVLSDGSPTTRAYGWGRVYPYLRGPNGSNVCTINKNFKGKIHHIRVYDRYLRTSEAIANYTAGCPNK